MSPMRRRRLCHPRRSWAWLMWHEWRTHWGPGLFASLDDNGVHLAGIEVCLFIVLLTLIALQCQR